MMAAVFAYDPCLAERAATRQGGRPLSGHGRGPWRRPRSIRPLASAGQSCWASAPPNGIVEAAVERGLCLHAVPQQTRFRIDINDTLLVSDRAIVDLHQLLGRPVKPVARHADGKSHQLRPDLRVFVAVRVGPSTCG